MIKFEQIELFPELKAPKRKNGICFVCKRPIKHGTMGKGCYRKILKDIKNHRQAIEICKKLLTQES